MAQDKDTDHLTDAQLSERRIMGGRAKPRRETRTILEIMEAERAVEINSSNPTNEDSIPKVGKDDKGKLVR